MDEPHETSDERGTDFTELSLADDKGFVAEFVAFLVHRKKWWLAPILIVLLLLGIVMLMSSSVTAPFIYPLF